jgi:hypothetical protein
MLPDMALVLFPDEELPGVIASPPACPEPIVVAPLGIVVVVLGDIVPGCICPDCIDEFCAIATGANAPIAMVRPIAAANASERIKLSPVKEARPLAVRVNSVLSFRWASRFVDCFFAS